MSQEREPVDDDATAWDDGAPDPADLAMTAPVSPEPRAAASATAETALIGPDGPAHTMAIHAPDDVPTAFAADVLAGTGGAAGEAGDGETQLVTGLMATSVEPVPASTELLPEDPDEVAPAAASSPPASLGGRSASGRKSKSGGLWRSGSRSGSASGSRSGSGSGPASRSGSGSASGAIAASGGRSGSAPTPGAALASRSSGAAPAPGPGGVLRFGPGVPTPSQTAAPGAVAAWHSGGGADDDGERPAKRRRGWVLLGLVLVLLVLAALIFWERSSGDLAVTGVRVTPPSAPLTCGATATVTATLTTNGDAGTVKYRWLRSDGTASSQLQQQFAKGVDQARVSLLWTFDGKGSLHATATLQVLSPGTASASAGFDYSCK